jgi:hypothetical protein
VPSSSNPSLSSAAASSTFWGAPPVGVTANVVEM